MQPGIERNWYVFYTRPRFEKKIKKHLDRQEIQNFLPTYLSLRKWKDRKKKVEMLYFPGYIFVSMEEHKLWEVMAVDGVIQLVKQGGKPAIVPDKDIDALFRLKLEDEPEIVDTSEIGEGQTVIITNGPMKGRTGQVFKIKSKLKLGVKIEGIDKSILIEISSNDVEMVPSAEVLELVD